ncbi:GAF domain-containing protein [Vallicoccus soli]|uniref:GAF domain-containing protein n=1 Tax=Vallicoccus soli TaxID=2339232 RepID=A0A3A3Z3M3_9ACTN|nr:GAF domain-containing protein [Vallicoccus soli]
MPEPDFARVFDEAPAPFLLLTPDFTIVHANKARLEATATTLEATVGRNLFDVFPMNPDDPAADGLRNLSASLARVRDTGRPETMPLQKYDIPMADGTFVERWWSPRNVPVHDDAGRVVLLLHRSDDITEYVRDRDAARLEAARGQRWRERAEQVEADLWSRTRELEAANAALSATTESARRAARDLAGLAATAAALAAAETTGDLVGRLLHHGRLAVGADRLAVALHEDGGLRVAPADACAGTPPALAAAAAGQRILVPDAPADDGAGLPPGGRAWALLPLRAGGRAHGALAVGWDQPHAFGEGETALLEALAAQCAQAVDRVGRLEAEREQARATRSLAESLQRSLLTRPPQVDHLEIDVRYQAAAQAAHVGGDWYDAFVAPGGATTLVIGDVTGHDQDAAAVMGQLRGMLRGVAHAVDGTPAHVLSALDRAVADLGVRTLATAVLARVEQAPALRGTGRRTLRWSNAGHPPPLLLRADGSAEVLERPADLLLGLLPQTARADHEVELHPGDTVVLYTDGLVERRGELLDTGLARASALASSLAGLPLPDLCRRLVTRLAPDAEDDVALVALRAHPEP